MKVYVKTDSSITLKMFQQLLRLSIKENLHIVKNTKSTIVLHSDAYLTELFVQQACKEMNLQLFTVDPFEIFSFSKTLLFSSNLREFFKRNSLSIDERSFVFIKDLDLYFQQAQLDDELLMIQIILFNQILNILNGEHKIVATCRTIDTLPRVLKECLFDSVVQLNSLSLQDLHFVLEWIGIVELQNEHLLEGKSIREIVSLRDDFNCSNSKCTFDEWITKTQRKKYGLEYFNVDFFERKSLEKTKLIFSNVFGYSSEFSSFGIASPRGILLHGPPGTGKSTIAKYMHATFERVSYYSVKITDVLHAEIGDSERSIRNLFQVALDSQPSLIFIDEFDGLFSTSSLNDECNDNAFSKILLQFVHEIDSLQEGDKVAMLAATNFRDAIPSELLFPGRFEVCIEIPYPNEEQIVGYLLTELKRENFDQSILDWIGCNEGREQISTKFKSPAAIANLLNYLKSKSIELGRAFEKVDFLQAVS